MSLEQQPKPNLIYIASIGRSGSTLLEMLLGAHSRIATAGEIQLWPHEIKEHGVQPCGCGKAVPECSFWAEMRQRVDPLQQPWPQIHFFREQHNRGRVLRLQRLREVYGREPAHETITQIGVYGRNNYEVFQAFLDLVEGKNGVRPCWIADASKDYYRLLWLLQSDLFNIKVLHLTKAPCAFVYSTIKHRLTINRAPLTDRGLLLWAVRMSLSWTIQNELIAQIARNYLPASDCLLVHYEKLASEPQATLKEICAMVGLDFEEQMLSHFYGSHAIAGNSGARFQEKGIVLDDAWKTSLPARYQKLVNALTFFSESRHGY